MSEPATQKVRSHTFLKIIKAGCTLDLSEYYATIVPTNLLLELASAARAHDAHLIISGENISELALHRVVVAGRQHLTVKF